jgi:hypothetical protein
LKTTTDIFASILKNLDESLNMSVPAFNTREMMEQAQDALDARDAALAEVTKVTNERDAVQVEVMRITNERDVALAAKTTAEAVTKAAVDTAAKAAESERNQIYADLIKMIEDSNLITDVGWAATRTTSTDLMAGILEALQVAKTPKRRKGEFIESGPLQGKTLAEMTADEQDGLLSSKLSLKDSIIKNLHGPLSAFRPERLGDLAKLPCFEQ